MSSQGNLFVVAAPSGAGKTSLVRAIIHSLDQVEISISYTTRPPRPGDINARDYFFVAEEEFRALLAQGIFLEYACIYGYHYGTSRDWVMTRLNQGIDVILEIDWQGAMQVRRCMPEAVLVFILPPSLATLHQRLQQRQQDDAEVIAIRMASAQEEIKHCEEFDYLVVNEHFDEALNDLQHIICAWRLRSVRQRRHHSTLLQQLLGKGYNL